VNVNIATAATESEERGIPFGDVDMKLVAQRAVVAAPAEVR
jgi:hypothetical protein